MRLSRPFIRLPFAFDAARLALEVQHLPARSWMPHPSGMRGNSAVALISSDGGDNDSFAGPKRATPHLNACPYAHQVLASFDEVLSRSRLMKLAAGAEVALHVDFNYHWFKRVRIHIPVVTNPRVIFHCGAERLHMGAGECWIFDSWRRHRVFNGGAEDRVHLVIDTCGSSRFWNMVSRVEAKRPAAVAAETRLVGYEPDAAPTVRTEQVSGLPVMAPGECEALIEDLVADFMGNPANDPKLARGYAKLLRGFAQDWRALWLVHGQHGQGLPDYRALIRATRARLHPNRRALTTASNGIGVNAVFAQRVLNAALGADAEHGY